MATTKGASEAPIANSYTRTISGNSDIVLSLLTLKYKDEKRYLYKYKVEKQALTSFSGYFEASLRFNEKFHHEIQLKGDEPGALGIWLTYMHAANDGAASTRDTGDSAHAGVQEIQFTKSDAALFNQKRVVDASISRIWHMINVGDKYLFNPKLLTGFFKEWYTKNVDFKHMEEDLARQLALPCYMFDHAEGFAQVTKWLAYNFAGHIKEKRPPGFMWQHMHLCPPDFVGPMNHARGSLKTRLHGGLWEKVGKLLSSGCKCGKWAHIAGKYFAELVLVDAYPLETTFPKASINTILTRLAAFDLEGEIDHTCVICNIDWDREVEKAIERTRGNFDGLCLDCMDATRVKRGSQDADYWQHLKSVDGRWDTRCRVRHGQQTWYVSWCGRDEHRRKLLDQHWEAKREERNFHI